MWQSDEVSGSRVNRSRSNSTWKLLEVNGSRWTYVWKLVYNRWKPVDAHDIDGSMCGISWKLVEVDTEAGRCLYGSWWKHNGSSWKSMVVNGSRWKSASNLVEVGGSR